MDEELTEQEAEAMAQEIAEAVPAIRQLVALDKPSMVKVVKHLVDKQIGDDPTAVIRNIAGMPASVVEVVTDPLLGLLAQIVVSFLKPDEVTDA